ncbi:MAG: FG-GAP-like repeat-containing protein [Bacteroidota bacterium]
MKKKLLLFPLVAVLLYVVLSSNNSGPGSTSGVNATTAGCSCHNAAATSTTNVSIQLLSGATPVASYFAGGSYTVRLTGVQTGGSLTLPRFGFQVSSTNTGGTTAGTLTAPTGTHTVTLSGVTIVEHNTSIAATTGSGGSGTTYVIDIPWTAPSAGTGNVTFRGVINAVNNNGANDAGDKWNSIDFTISETSSTTAPTITALSTLSGNPGSSVTITGTGFNTTAANNVVYFGATKATVSSASATSLGVTVPDGATHQPVSVLNTVSSLGAYAKYPFLPTFNNAGYIASTLNFDNKVDFAASSNAYCLAIADLDNDGKSEMLVGQFSGGNLAVYRNISSSGSITAASFATKVDLTVGTGITSIAVGDIDGDGKPDIVITRSTVATVSVFRNISTTGSITTGSFATKVDFTTNSSPRNVAIDDVDLDGKPDLVIGYSSSDAVSVLRNTATAGTITTGSFATKVDLTAGTAPYDVATGDMDGDGKPDIVAVNQASNTVSVFRNTATSGTISSGSFATKIDFTTGTSPQGVSIKDIDGDGKLDIVVANYSSGSISVFRNTATSGSITTGSFSAKVDFTVGTNPYVVAAGDLDGDGKPDIAVTNYGSATISLLHNTSASGSITTSSFATKIDFVANANPHGIVVGDLDGDNKPDIAFSNGISSGSTVSVLRNNPLISAPIITSVSPILASPGASVTITGSNFNTTAANNIVYFGATKATVSAASGTTLNVSVPSGSTFSPVTVHNSALSLAASSQYPFLPTYNSSSYLTNFTNFNSKVDFTSKVNGTGVAIADIDGDGKADMIVSHAANDTIMVYRNTSTSGVMNSSSFATPVSFVTPGDPSGIAIVDIDMDGKPDMVVANAGFAGISIFRNIATPGAITTASFASRVDFAASGGTSYIAVRDVDMDGKPDIVATNDIASVSVWRNVTATGLINTGSLAPRVDFSLPAVSSGLAVADIDGDGKPEIISSNVNHTFSVLQNTAALGSINSVSFSSPVNFSTGSPVQPRQLAVADIDGDNKLDVAVILSFTDAVAVFRNTSSTGVINSSTFSAKVDFGVGFNPSRIAIGDINGDSKPDIAVSNFSDNTLSILRNTATSGTIDVTSFAVNDDYNVGSSPRGIAIGDLDGDAIPDILVANSGSSFISVLRNSPITSLTSPPTITSVTPLTANPASTITITGTNFNTTAANNIVYMGARKATVSSASTTALNVTMPAGASFSPVVVHNTGSALSVYSQYPFLPKYNNAAYRNDTVVFAVPANFAALSGPYASCIADIDGDGKPDIIVSNLLSDTISIYRNVSTSGSLTTASFAAKVDFVTPNAPWKIVVGDLDMDGKADICVAHGTGLSVFRNTASPGSITSSSLAAPVSFNISLGSSRAVAISDIDGDGKPELTVTNSGTQKVTVFRNLSTPGTISNSSFGARVEFSVHTAPSSVSFTDIDGDGKGDMVVCSGSHNSVSVLRNIATQGGVNRASFTTEVNFSTGPVGGPVHHELADFDGDGKVDIAVATPGGGKISIFRNTSSTGSITTSSFAARVNFVCGGNDLAVSDFNGDGKPDIAVSNGDSGTVSIFRNIAISGIIDSTSFATKINIGVTSNSIEVNTADLDGDGIPDLSVAHQNNTLSIYRNTPMAATMSAITGTLTVCVGSNTTLSNTTSGGTWSSANASVAVVGSSSGIVTGIAAGTAMISYSAGASSVTAVVTVNALPSAIGGTLAVCPGNTTSVTSTPSGGVWSSASTAVASVGSATGVVMGVSAGTTNMTYTLSTGCRVTGVVTVHVNPAAITGTFTLTTTVNTTLSSATTGGAWSSSNTSVATVNTSGIVTGVAAGTATISYTLGTGCRATAVVTVSSASGSAASFSAGFSLTPGSNPHQVAIGDIDGDGKPDIAVANIGSNTVSVYRNISTGGTLTSGSFATKVDFSTGSSPAYVAISDIDGDTKPDMLVTNFASNTISIYRNTATSGAITTGSFAASVSFSTPSGPRWIQVADFDGDTKPDVAICSYYGDNVSVFRNTATVGSVTTGSLASRVDFAVGTTPYAISAADFDGDGKADIAAANAGSNNISVLRNVATSGSITTGSFASPVSFATAATPYAVSSGDIDGDGKPELVSSNNGAGSISVLRNTATSGVINTGSFAAKVDFTTPGSPGSNVLTDANGDGKLDIAVTNYGGASVSVFRNTASYGVISSGSLASPVTSVTGSGPLHVAAGDLNADAMPDLVTANYTAGTITILQNSVAAAPPTITSVSPNLANPGASITITGTNFNTTAANNVVHFGATRATVGSASATSLAVTVPSGATYMPVSVNNTGINLIAYAPSPFLPKYDNSAYAAGSVNFLGKIDFTAGTNAYSVALGDVDGDGKADMVVASSWLHKISVYRNTSTTGVISASSFGSPTDFTTGNGPNKVLIADVDLDGKQDILTSNGGSASVSVFRNIAATGSITTASLATRVDFTTFTTPTSLAIADIDADGKPELMTSSNSSMLSVLRNTSAAGAINSGSFATNVDFATGTTAFGIAAGDIDGDGKPDVVTANYNAQTISVFRNTSTAGAITTASLAAKVDISTGADSYPIGVAMGDLDGDNKMDVAVTTNNNALAVLRNTATTGAITTGSFAAGVTFATGTGTRGIAIGDIDGDGKADLVTANSTGNSISVLRNTATSGAITSASFAAKADFATAAGPYSVTIGDIDGDGEPEVAVPNYTAGSVSILSASPFTSTTGTMTVCVGSTTTLANATSGGTWSSGTTAVATVGATTGVVTGIGAGTATISYITSVGTSTAVVTVNPLPAAISGTLTVCQGISATLTNATSGGSWSSSASSTATVGLTSGILTGVTAGTATISYTVAATGCRSFATATVLALPTLYTVTGGGSYCSGGTGVVVGLSGSNTGTTYQLYNGASVVGTSVAGTSSSINFGLQTAPGVYSVGATSSFSCTRAMSGSATITVNSLPATVSGSSFVCTGSATTLSNSTSGGAWTSSNTAVATITSGGVVMGVSGGTVTISYTLGTGCSATKVVTVGALPSVTAIIGASSVCAGFSITLTDTTAGGSWTSGASAIATVNTSGVVTGLAGGTATISYTVTGSCGSASATKVVTVNAVPTVAAISGASTVCTGSSISLSNTTSGGSWSSSDTAVFVSGAGVVTGLSAGAATVSYTVTNSCGSTSVTKVVTVNAVASAGTITGAATVNVGATMTLANAVSGGAWSTSSPSIATISSGVVFGVALGSATISYTVTGACGTSVATKSVTVASPCGNVITTIAGNGTGGFFGDAGPATAAGISVPQGIVFDGPGNLYFADWGNHRIRKIDLAGNITTIAGNGASTYSGDGGPATAASFNFPTGLAIDTVGNLYFTDPGHHVVRKINTSGIISTIAGTGVAGYSGDGGPATAAQLNTAYYLVIDNSGNLIIADNLNNRVRKINASGIITTIAGTGASSFSGDGGPAISATFSKPSGVGIDAIGNIYVCDFDNYRVRKINTSGNISTIAGTGSSGFSGDGGPATSANLRPNNVFADAIGNVFITDQFASRVRVINSSGIINTFAGTGTAGFSGDGGPATAANIDGPWLMTRDNLGNYYISDQNNNRIRKISPSGLPTVAPIGGSSTVCVGSSVALSDTTSGGSWTSSAPTIATVNTSGVINGVAPGIVTISYTVSNSCGSTTVTKVVTVTSSPSVAAISGASSVCAGSSITLSDTTAGGSWTSSAPTFASVSSAGVVMGLNSGTVTISYTVANSCGNTSVTKIITINPLPNAGSISGTASVCAGAATTLSNTVSGGSWISGNTAVATITSAGIVNGVAAGTATISYMVANTCGTAMSTRIVTVNPLPTVAGITGASTVCAGSSITLADATTGGSWTSSTTAIATVSSAGVVNGVSAGMATISYTVSNACGSVTATSVVTVNALPAAGTITGASSVCAGAATSLSNTVSGGTWSSGSTSVATVTASGLVSGVSGGVAVITYTVVNGCGTANATKSITVNPLPAVSAISGASSVCTGVSTSMTNATTGGMWTSSAPSIATVTTSGLVNGVAAGITTISYSVTNSCGSTTVTRTVTVNASPNAGTITGSAAVNTGATMTLTTTGTSGSWTASNTNASVSSAGVVTGLTVGTVTISYTATNTCGTAMATKMVTVTTTAPIMGTLGICIGGSSSLSHSITGGTWSSTNSSVATIGATTGVVTPVAAGTTTISYSHSGGVTTAVVTVSPLPASISGILSVCVGSATTLSDGTSGGTWSSADVSVAAISGTGIVTGVAAGTVVVSYTLPTGCAATRTVTVNTAPSAISGPTTVCIGAPGTLASSPTGGTWISSVATVASVSSAGVVTGMTQGTSNITYTLANGCRVNRPVTVNATPTVPAISGSSSVNVGSTITLSNTTTGGAWTVSNSNATISGSGVVSGVGAGTVTVSYTVTNVCGTAQATKIVTVNAVPISGTATVCAGSATTLTFPVSGGSWTSGNTAVAVVGSSNGVVTGVSVGTSMISYTYSGGTVTRIVTVNAAPSVGAISGASMICTGTTTPLTNPTTSGMWTSSATSIAGVNSVSGVVTGNSAGVATITYAISNSCGTANAIKPVTVNASPSAGTISGIAAICTGATSTLASTVSGGTWTSSNTAVATIGTSINIVSGISAGTATISYIVTNGCGTATATRVVTVSGAPAAGTITGTPSVCIGSTRTLANTVTGGVWSSSDGSLATVGAANGVVSGVSAGIVTISYAVSSACGTSFATRVVTVNSAPAVTPITGTTMLCTSGTTTLSNATTGGTWSSATTSVATISSTTGVVTGVSAGTALISYAVNTVCGISVSTTTVTVNATSAVTISGSSTVCVGASVVLTPSVAGGTWTSASTGIATVDSFSGSVTGIGPGVAVISYASMGTCGVVYATKMITVNTVPSPGTITGTATVCAGSSTSLAATVSGGMWVSGATGIAVVGSATGIVTGVSGGMAAISYLVSNACGTSAAVRTVTVNSAPGAGAITGALAVCSGSTTSLSNSATGGTWSSSNTSIATISASTGVVSAVAAGTATISYVRANSCGTAIALATVTVELTPSAGTLSGAPVVCVGASTTLSSTVSGGAWWSSDTAKASVGAATGIVTGMATGTVLITYNVTNSCGTAIATTAMTVNATPVASTISGATNVCLGSSVTLSNATAGGSWSSSDAAVATIGASSGVVNGLTSGTAIITYTVSNTCGSDAAMVTVTVNASPSAGTISGAGALCIGSALTVSNSVGGGAWSSSNTAVATINTSGVVTAITAGVTTISYTVTSSCGTATAVAAVTVNPSPDAGTITGPSFVNLGATITLATSGTGGTWSMSNANATIDAGGVVTGAAFGTDTAYYTVMNSCGTDMASKEVVVGFLIDPITGTLNICSGGTTTLSSSTPGGTWSSNAPAVAVIDSMTGVVTGVFSGTAIISYSVSGFSATAILTVNASPSAITGTMVICEGAVTTLHNVMGGGAWTSSDISIATVGSNNGAVTGVSGGVADISYTLSTGCYSIASFTVNSLPPAITGPTGICIGLTATLSNTATGGTWTSSNPAIASIGSGTGIASGMAAGMSNITYTAATGCRRSITVTVTPLPATITGPSSVCEGSSITLSTTSTGGTWSSGDMAVATVGTNGIVTGTGAGTATITYAFGAGCARTAVVSVNPLPDAITGISSVCIGLTTTLASSTTGGTWSTSASSIANVVPTTGVVTGVAAGTARISYTLGTGCRVFTIVTTSALPPNISGVLKVCQGATTSLSNSAAGGTWSSGSVFIASVGMTTGVVNGNSPGTAVISYTIGTGCFKTAVVTVNPLPMPITGTTTVCVGGTTTLSNATPGVSWTSSASSIAAINSSTGVVTGMSAGAATITYTLGTGCYITTAVSVSPIPATVGGTRTVCIGQVTTLTNTMSGGTWTSGNVTIAAIDPTTGIVSGASAGIVPITYTVPGGCFKTTTVTVNALPMAHLGYPMTCVGTTTTLTGGSGGYWSSGSPSIATVGISTGVVTGVAAGTVGITYMFASTGCTRSSVVTVNPVPPSISGTATVCPGLTTTLANGLAGGTWSSSNAAGATIGSATGIVTGVNAGTVLISYSFGANCRTTRVLSINPLPAAISGPVSMCNTMTANLVDATPGGTWSSSNTAAATIGSASGVVYGVAAGSATLTYTLPSTGCYVTAPMTVVGCVKPGSPSVSPFTGIRLFPNPTSGSITVEADDAGTLHVYTIDGKEVTKYDLLLGSTLITLPKELAAGVYMCRYNGNNGGTMIIRLVFEP